MIPEPRCSSNPEWDRLTFSFSKTDYLYRSFGDSGRDPVWDSGAFPEFGEVRFAPAASFMSYGLGVFEGLKAHRTPDGSVLLFRPEQNARRFQMSAERLMMAPFPEQQFVGAVEELVRRNARFVPPCGKGSFYIRPTEHAVDPQLGLRPCRHFAVLMYGSPVGSYFQGSGSQGIRLRVLEQARVAAGGTGNAKAMGNYAGSLLTVQRWKNEGFDDVLFLDARHLRYVTETCGSNFFLLRKDDTLVTPPLDDQILAGITRDSVITAARELLRLRVEERPVAMDEVIDQGSEVFCTGTAWTVQGVREIVHQERSYGFPSHDLSRSLREILQSVQCGARPDPFGWAYPVSGIGPDGSD